jgi:hypothetical protein
LIIQKLKIMVQTQKLKDLGSLEKEGIEQKDL